MQATIGQFLKYEAPQNYSREDVTVASGQTLVPGQVVGRVTASGKIAAFNPTASDGTQNAIGIAFAAVDASGGDKPGVIIARHAIVVDRDNLVWAGSPTNAQKDAAIAQLKALGILAEFWGQVYLRSMRRYGFATLLDLTPFTAGGTASGVRAAGYAAQRAIAGRAAGRRRRAPTRPGCTRRAGFHRRCC
jgi:hypothetical protein